MKSSGELNRLRSAAVFQFCTPLTGQSSHSERLNHVNERRKVERYCNRFFVRMNSSQPFETPEDAIAAIAPVAVWFIGWAARQLAIAVIRFLWDRWHSGGSP